MFFVVLEATQSYVNLALSSPLHPLHIIQYISYNRAPPRRHRDAAKSLTLPWNLCREKRARRGTLEIAAIDAMLIRTQGVVAILPHAWGGTSIAATSLVAGGGDVGPGDSLAAASVSASAAVLPAAFSAASQGGGVLA